MYTSLCVFVGVICHLFFFLCVCLCTCHLTERPKPVSRVLAIWSWVSSTLTMRTTSNQWLRVTQTGPLISQAPCGRKRRHPLSTTCHLEKPTARSTEVNVAINHYVFSHVLLFCNSSNIWNIFSIWVHHADLWECWVWASVSIAVGCSGLYFGHLSSQTVQSGFSSNI